MQSDAEKVALARAWLRCWTRPGIWLSVCRRLGKTGRFASIRGGSRDMSRLLNDRSSLALFEREWLPKLLETFAEPLAQGRFRLKGRELSLEIGGTWAYCQSCRTAQRPFPGRKPASIADTKQQSLSTRTRTKSLLPERAITERVHWRRYGSPLGPHGAYRSGAYSPN